MSGQQLLQPAAQFRVPGARLVEERGSFGRVGPIQGFDKEVEFVHGKAPLTWSVPLNVDLVSDGFSAFGFGFAGVGVGVGNFGRLTAYPVG